MGGIDHQRPANGGKPDFPIGHLTGRRLHAGLALDRSQAFERAEWRAGQSLEFSAGNFFSSARLTEKIPLLHANQRFPSGPPDDPEDVIVVEPILDGIRVGLAAVENAKASAASADPEPAVGIEKELLPMSGAAMSSR